MFEILKDAGFVALGAAFSPMWVKLYAVAKSLVTKKVTPAAAVVQAEAAVATEVADKTK